MMLGKALRAMSTSTTGRVSRTAAVAVCALWLGGSLPAQAPSKVQNLKEAQRELHEGEKAEAAGKLNDALAHYDRAAVEAPLDAEIAGHRAALRAKLVRVHVDAAENAAIHGDLRKASDELHTALRIDPGNAAVAEREAQMRSMREEEPLPAGPPE